MRLHDITTIEITGLELATALGYLKYIRDEIDTGESQKQIESLITKLEQERDKEL